MPQKNTLVTVSSNFGLKTGVHVVRPILYIIAVCASVSAQVPGCVVKVTNTYSYEIVAGVGENCRMDYGQRTPEELHARPGPGEQRATLMPLGTLAAIALDANGDLYISDQYAARVYRVDASTGFAKTVAGDGTPGFTGDGGPAASAQLNQPQGIALDGDGNLYIADFGNSRIRKVTKTTGTISTIAGNGNPDLLDNAEGKKAISSPIDYPQLLAIDPAGNLYYTEMVRPRIRKIEHRTGIIRTVVGAHVFTQPEIDKRDFGTGGPARNAYGGKIGSIALDHAGNLFLANSSNDPLQNVIREVDAKTGIIRMLVGDQEASGPIAVDSNNDLYFSSHGRLARVDTAGLVTFICSARAAALGGPCGVGASAVDAQGLIYYAQNAGGSPGGGGVNRLRATSSPIP